MSAHLSESLQLVEVPNSRALSTAASTRQHFRRTAWGLCALLLSIGRDAPVGEIASLASRWTLSQVSSEFIEFLCRIPDSPISITSEYCVTLSLRSLSDLERYVSDSGLAVQALVPRIVEFLKRSRRMRKRVLSCFTGENNEEGIVPSLKRMRMDCEEVRDDLSDRCSVTRRSPGSNDSITVNGLALSLPTLFHSSELQFGGRVSETGENKQKGICMSTFVQNKDFRQIMALELNHSSRVCSRVYDHEIDVSNITSTCCLEGKKQGSEIPLNDEAVNDSYKVTDLNSIGIERTMEDHEEGIFLNLCGQGETLEFLPQSNAVFCHTLPERGSESINKKNVSCNLPYLSNTLHNVEDDAVADPAANLGLRSPESSVSLVTFNRDATPRELDLLHALDGHKMVTACPERKQNKTAQISISRMQKSRLNRDALHFEEENKRCLSPPSVGPAKRKVLPDFESYTVVEEEGSGGYGTVYRAQRKSDGTTVAIKCPHADAHKGHVNNELRMLERFGGRSFIIKYDGCFKSGDSDCFVLEHVEHDRPEVLKKEIDIFQLQWYGYCLFRALASLHKQGIVHRDVKPGNFLFSRKTNKGYLIDFNLAMDLHQKYRTPNKSRASSNLGPNHASLLNVKSEPAIYQKKHPMTKSSNLVASQVTKGSRLALAPKSFKKAAGKLRSSSDLKRWTQFKSQGADGSGITSAKDVSSTRTPSGERRREPLLCQGRKELISLVQENMSAPNQEKSRVPTTMRKRVAASPARVEKPRNHFTPMPVKSNGLAIAEGEGKTKKEGSCAGTKGFRAPEVCLRSPHQGPRTDIWSAGVTLLYLMIGKAPFSGDPEQNMKEIARLRGSEDLWEVAKLHSRESSFPEELYDVQHLPSMNLREWCSMNTRRREFLELIPKSLFDLVDKCLTVNPRLRISAEEALKHDFFAPVTESLKKQRILRQEHNGAKNLNISLELSLVC